LPAGRRRRGKLARFSERQRDYEGGSAAGRWLRCGRSAVSLDHGGDDRETEPDASAGAGARRVDAIEALEHAGGLLLRQPWAMVGNGQRRVAVVVAEVDRDRRARGRVRARVREEIVEHLAQPILVAGERRRL